MDGFGVRPDELVQGAELTRQSASVLGDGHRAFATALQQASAATGGGALAGVLGELVTALDTAATELGTVLEQSAVNLRATAAAYHQVDAGTAGALDAMKPEGER